MLNIIFRLWLTLNATSLLAIIFMVHRGYSLLSYLSHKLPIFSRLNIFPDWVSYTLYVFILLLSTYVSTLLSSKLSKDEFKEGEVKNIEYANNSFLPSYLGYFFVALSINNWEMLIFIYIIIFIFTFLSQALYFNPIFLIFGYNFYNITTVRGTGIFLISKQKYRKPDEVIIPTVFRINNYTFIDIGRK